MNRQCTYSLNRLYDNSTQIGQLLQDNTYKYDNVGNIISIDDYGLNARNQYFEYDNINRLIGSDGSIMQEHSTAQPYGYESGYKYSLAGRLLNKYVDSKRLSTAMGPHTVRYDNEYSYTHPDNPYAVTHIQDAYGAHYDFDWDDNGNLVNSHTHATHTDRRLCWTEDNRLQAFIERGGEGGIAAYYNYSADGERNIKLTSPRLNIQQNATLFNNPPLVYPTLYASPLVTLTKQGYTKHYFEEGRRICSKIGGGMRGNVTVQEIDSRVGELASSYDEQYHNQKEGIRQTFYHCIGADPQIIDGVNLHRMLVEREVRRDEEEPTYFYHSDHLGSAAYLTYHGGVIQTLNYLPYGEDWVEYNFFHPDDTTRLGIYRFNGKEKDYESGFHYYGARYYWSEILTGWLSIDPMMDKYPSISPYAYCVWNPIKLADPDGEFPRLPRWLRIMTSKNVYEAIGYKMKHGGDLEVWEHHSGCIFASVQTNQVRVDETGAPIIEAKMFRPEGYSDHAEIKATTDIFVNVESWMDEPATGLIDFGIKTVASIGYSTINDLAITLTGHSLGGTEATPNERAEACVGYVSGKLGRGLKKGMGLIKTEGATGLGKYNDFVHKMGNYQGKTKKKMGRLYQQNKNLNNAVSTYDNSRRIIDGVSTLEKEK